MTKTIKVREPLTDKQWDEIFYKCPGAWYGNKPDPTGYMAVDGDNIVAAIQYLLRHRLTVMYARGSWEQGGILLAIKRQPCPS